MELILKLRTAAIKATTPSGRDMFHMFASQLEQAVTDFTLTPTENNLIALNGAWSIAKRVAKTIPPEGDPAPLSGSPYAPYWGGCQVDMGERKAS
jgi:hypothetical protein